MSLSTHVLDTSSGVPAANVPLRLKLDLFTLFEGTTDSDGRCNELRHLQLAIGEYRLEFEVADYFRAMGHDLPVPPFLDLIAIEFGMAEMAAHYHVPLLVSPYGYSTYRGS